MKAGAAPAIAILLLLAACGAKVSPAEQTADNLEEAADQSDPAAAGVLDNAADQVRETDGTGLPANTAEMAQNAMSEAGAAAANSQ